MLYDTLNSHRTDALKKFLGGENKLAERELIAVNG